MVSCIMCEKHTSTLSYVVIRSVSQNVSEVLCEGHKDLSETIESDEASALIEPIY